MVSLEAENDIGRTQWMDAIKGLISRAMAEEQGKAAPWQPANASSTTSMASATPAVSPIASVPAPAQSSAGPTLHSFPGRLPPSPAAVPASPPAATSAAPSTPAPSAAPASTLKPAASSVPSPSVKPAASPAATPSPSSSSAVAAATRTSTSFSGLPPLLDVAQRFKPSKPLVDSLSLLAYGCVFRMYHSQTIGGKVLLTNVIDQLVYVDFSARSDSRLGSRGASAPGSVAATPRTKNASSPVLNASLYYCPPGSRTKVPGQVVWITDILAVHEGKHAAASLFEQAEATISSPQACIIPASHCFTLTVATSPTSTALLTFQAPSKSLRALFLRGLADIFERQLENLRADAQAEREAGNEEAVDPERVAFYDQSEPDDDHLIEQPAVMSPRARSPSPEDEDDGDDQSALPSSPRAKRELLTLLMGVMSHGEEFTLHTLPAGATQPTRQSVFVWVEFPDSTPAESEDEDDVINSPEGAILYWYERTPQRTQTPAQN